MSEILSEDEMRRGMRTWRPPQTEKQESELSAPHGSLSGFGSEILISTWETHAEVCDATADQFAAVTKHLVCSYREKARAYRKCVEDLRRQMAHENKRQPTENTQPSDRTQEPNHDEKEPEN